MDIRELTTFVRVAELHSFSKTAEELAYVQSTVTMQIQHLERELGYPLFDRIGRQVTLTAAGAEFLEYAYKILHLAEQATALGGKQDRPKGLLRVGVLESLLLGSLWDLLPQFCEEQSGMELQVKMGERTELVQYLKQNQLDLVYINGGGNTDADLQCCYRREERMVFVSNPHHPMAQKEEVSVKELLTYDLVVTERTGFCYDCLRELAARCGGRLHHSVEVDSTAMVVHLVQQGRGVAMLPRYAVLKELQAGRLVEIAVDMPPQVYYSQLLSHRKRWLSPAMLAFVEAVRQSEE